MQVGGGQSEGRVERDAGTVQGGVGLLLRHRLLHDPRLREHAHGGRQGGMEVLCTVR